MSITDSDHFGKKYNKLTVLGYDKMMRGSKGNVSHHWKVLCDCGTETSKNRAKILSGHTKSCGCEKYKGDKITIYNSKLRNIGKKFHEWTVLEITKRKSSKWRCRCSCGVEKLVEDRALFIGASKSCGCKRPKREQVYNWNPQLTDEQRLKGRDFREYQIWRKSVFERDNYTCEISGEKGGRLAAHHLISWSSNEDLRLELSNGVTVSENLHREFHKTYGYSNNTREQFEEFKSNYDCFNHSTNSSGRSLS